MFDSIERSSENSNLCSDGCVKKPKTQPFVPWFEIGLIFIVFGFVILGLFHSNDGDGKKNDLVSERFSHTEIFDNLKSANIDYLSVESSGKIIVSLKNKRKFFFHENFYEMYNQKQLNNSLNPKSFALKISDTAEYYGDSPNVDQTKDEFFSSINLQVTSIIDRVENILSKEDIAAKSWRSND